MFKRLIDSVYNDYTDGSFGNLLQHYILLVATEMVVSGYWVGYIRSFP